MNSEKLEYQPWEIPDIADADDIGVIRQRLAAIKQQSHVEGMQQGREQGYTEGYQEGYRKGESDIAELKKTLADVVSIFTNPLQAVSTDLELKLVHCLQALSKKLIKRELSLDPTIIYQVVCQAKQLIFAEGTSYRLHLPAADCQVLRSMLTPEQLKEFEIIEDKNLAAGDFLLHSDKSTIDGRLNERLANMLAKILGDANENSA